MYYKLVNNILADIDYSINDPEGVPIELSYLTGKPLSCPVEEPLVFTTTATKNMQMRDFEDASFPLVSKRFLELLQGAGVNNIELTPAVIKSEVDGTLWKDYYVINITESIACVDAEKSIFEELMPGAYMFDQLAIHADKAKETLLFRLEEDKTSIIIHKSVGQYIVSKDPNKELLGWSIKRIIQ